MIFYAPVDWSYLSNQKAALALWIPTPTQSELATLDIVWNLRTSIYEFKYSGYYDMDSSDSIGTTEVQKRYFLLWVLKSLR